jgi:hypothetical protein
MRHAEQLIPAATDDVAELKEYIAEDRAVLQSLRLLGTPEAFDLIERTVASLDTMLEILYEHIEPAARTAADERAEMDLRRYDW